MEQAIEPGRVNQALEELLAASVAAHGHLCPGQEVGVRLAMLGCRLIGFEVPCPYHQLKKLIVFIEMDRCTGDAVAHVTGVKLGRRSPEIRGLRHYGRHLHQPGNRPGLPGNLHRRGPGPGSVICAAGT